MRRFAIMLVLCCLASPSALFAQTAGDYLNRSKELLDKGENDKAIDACNQALAAADPNNPKDRYNISYAYNNRAIAWDNKGDYDKAMANVNQGLAINPANVRGYVTRGDIWDDKGEHDEAMADYNEALALSPNDVGAYNNRGIASQKHGDYDKARADFQQALVADSNSAPAHNNLAWLYATCADAKYRDAKKAVENASEACRLSGGKNCYHLGTLAAAYAENGDFDKAQEFQAKAVDLVPEKEKAAFRSRLDLYKRGKRYRDELKKK